MNRFGCGCLKDAALRTCFLVLVLALLVLNVALFQLTYRVMFKHSIAEREDKLAVALHNRPRGDQNLKSVIDFTDAQYPRQKATLRKSKGSIKNTTRAAHHQLLLNQLKKTQNITVKKMSNYDGCEKWFEQTFEENLQVISNYPLDNVEKFVRIIDRNMTEPQQMMTSFPVIVTAANSDYFGVSQGLIKSIHEKITPKYKDAKIIYYDLGLTEFQNLQLRRYCKCEVRKFQFDEFPRHVRQLKRYTWKPIIVKTVLMEYGWVWWMDSSVRFVSNELNKPLQYSLNNSIFFIAYKAILSVAAHTDLRTMAYLGEDPCKFRHLGEVEATFTLYHFDHVTSVLVNQWVACALNEDCMAPVGAKLFCSLGNKNDGQCHRFDQAVLSIMIRRLYHDINDYPLDDKPSHIREIRRGEKVSYFPD